MTEGIREHFDSIADDYDSWKKKARVYYSHLKSLLTSMVPPNSVVCEVGCGTGQLLQHLKPSRGVGVDISPEMIMRARSSSPEYEWHVLDIEQTALEERFSFVIAVDVLEHVNDLTQAIANMGKMLDDDGTLIVTTAHPSWRPVLETAEKLRLKMPEGEHSWRSREEIVQAAEISALEVKRYSRSLLVPKALPGTKWANYSARTESLRQRLGLVQCFQIGR